MENDLYENVARLELLVDTGARLACERTSAAAVRIALDAGLGLCGASAGVFLAKTSPLDLGGAVWSTASQATAHPLRALLETQGIRLVKRAFQDSPILRSDDMRGEERLPYHLVPGQKDRLADVRMADVRSYLAAPLRTGAGGVLGLLLYGHPAVRAFPPEAEATLAKLAAQAAAAMEHARRYEQLTREIAALQATRAEGHTTRERLLQALEAAQLGTWHWCAGTGLIDFDERAAELFGVQSHVPLARNSLRRRVIHGEDLALTPEDLREVASSGRQYNVEYRVGIPGGGQRWVLVRGNAITTSLEEAEGMTGTVQDITPRKTQEEALRASEKLAATGRLAATIAHEINNPLEAVTNLIYLAKTDPETPPAVSRMLETADGELARVSQIAQGTLGFYRDTTRPVTIDLNQLLGAMVALFERKLSERRLHCTLDLEPGLSMVGLQGEIRQVVSNLLVNAIDASPGGGGRIRIRARHRHRRRTEGRGVAVLICDDGAGIPHHVRPRLFTPFVTTKQSTGTGLGLWVTRGMVEKHGGSVSFRSRTESPSGTVFRVFLPHSGVSTVFASPSGVAIQ